tara:strand:- start:270 stop:1172 length:903 start_codon:yes stop_codon:yes gene_type:complete
MKILVTGGLGHIGSYIIRTPFASSGICVVDDLSTNRYCSLMNLPYPIDFINDGFESLDEELLKQFDVVLHLAAVTDAARGDSEIIEKINVVHTRDFIKKLLSLERPPLFIFPSSTSVYGTASDIVQEDDENALKPQSHYASSKLTIENFLKENYPRYLILRFGTIFGVTPGMRFHTAINHFCWASSMKKPLEVWEQNYNYYRPYLDVGDAERTISHLIHKGIENETYNVLSGNYKCGDIIEIIRKKIPDIEVNMVKTPLLNQFSYLVDHMKLLNTGIRLNGNISRGINETLEMLKCVKKS